MITIDLANFLPSGEMATFDLKDHLFMGLILKEKDFREALKNIHWSVYQNKYVAINCSADAIIPAWAYMLVVTYLKDIARDSYVGTASEYTKHLFLKQLANIDINEFADQRIVVKGCGDSNIDSYAYAEITKLLVPVVKSIMYGEPCSTVPVYKRASASLNPAGGGTSQEPKS